MTQGEALAKVFVTALKSLPEEQRGDVLRRGRVVRGEQPLLGEADRLGDLVVPEDVGARSPRLVLRDERGDVADGLRLLDVVLGAPLHRRSEQALAVCALPVLERDVNVLDAPPSSRAGCLVVPAHAREVRGPGGGIGEPAGRQRVHLRLERRALRLTRRALDLEADHRFPRLLAERADDLRELFFASGAAASAASAVPFLGFFAIIFSEQEV